MALPHVIARFVKEPHAISFQYQTGQPTRRVRAGVDIDAVRSNIWLIDRCVAVHHDHTEILFVQEKIVSDLEQIPLGLPL
jgi:hypothetical protein